MALKKSITTAAGFTVEYWRITSYDADILRGCFKMQLTPYVNEAARRSNMQPVMSETKSISVYDGLPNAEDRHYTDNFTAVVLEEAAAQGKNVFNAMYEYIKSYVHEFIGSEDC